MGIQAEEQKYTGIIVLIGKRGEEWDYFEDCISPEWWELRLWTRRN